MTKIPLILLVDDDSTTNFLNRLLLNGLAVAEQLLVAHNGQEALDLLTPLDSSPLAVASTLVLLDINMPVMDGFEFMQAYTRFSAAQQQAIVVVMLTTSMHVRDLERVQQLPVASLVNKPLTKEKVEGILRAHFQRQLPAH